MIRILDIVFSLLGLIILIPVFLVIALWIKMDSKGPVFYRQKRVGKFGKEFWLVKLRSMRVDADKSGLLTVGGRDPRITNSGYFIRKYKLDELPQLFNVLHGDMSLVGPRPEVKKYTDMYTDSQRRVLDVRPGITDWASIEFRNENDILGSSNDPERAYIEEIMPRKIHLNLRFIERPTIAHYLQIVLKTILNV